MKKIIKCVFSFIAAFVLGFGAVVLPRLSSNISYASSFDNVSDTIVGNSWNSYVSRYDSTGNLFELSENRLFQFGSLGLYYFGNSTLYRCSNVTPTRINWITLNTHPFSGDVPDLNWDTIYVDGFCFLYKKNTTRIYLVSQASGFNLSFTSISVSGYPSSVYSNSSIFEQMWNYNGNTYLNTDTLVSFNGSTFTFTYTNTFNVPNNLNLNMYYILKSYDNYFYWDGTSSYKLNSSNQFEVSFISSVYTYNRNNYIFDGLNTVYYAGGAVLSRFNLDTLTFSASSTGGFTPLNSTSWPRAIGGSLFAGVNSDGDFCYLNSSTGNSFYQQGYNTGYQQGYNTGYQAALDGSSSSDVFNQGYQAGYQAGINLNSGYSTGYQSGYNIGYQAGILAGNTQGYEAGYESGNADGYNTGYQEGLAANNDYTFLGLIGAVIDAPIQAFTGLFNFEIFDVNIKNLLLALFTASIIVVVIKFALGAGGK
jgi:hypothetical protein